MTPYHLLTSPSLTPLAHRSPLTAALETALHTSNYTKSTADGRAIAWRHYWTVSILKHLPRNYCTICKTIARRVHCPDRLSAFVCRCYYYAAVWWRHRRRAPTGSDRTLVTNDTHTFSWVIDKSYVYIRWRFKVKHEHQFMQMQYNYENYNEYLNLWLFLVPPDPQQSTTSSRCQDMNCTR